MAFETTEAVEILKRILNIRVDLIYTAEVVSVDEAKGIIEVKRDGYENDKDVRLSAVELGSNHFVIIPKIGSIVSVAGYNVEYKQVISYSAIDKLKITNEELSLVISEGKLKLQSDGADLLGMILELIGYVKKIIVVQGTGPDVAGLSELENKFKKVLK